MSEKQKRGCLVWLKYIVGDPQKLWGILIVFMTMLSGVLVICVGLFSCATAAILPVEWYKTFYDGVGKEELYNYTVDEIKEYEGIVGVQK